MRRRLLDTNIISNVVKPQPSESLLSWMSMQRDEDLFIASLTVGEIRRGILEKPRGKKRDILDLWFSGPDGPQALFAGRILSFDDKAGFVWAQLMAEMLCLGYMPYASWHHGMGGCVDSGNVCIDGGFNDLLTLVPFDAIPVL